MHWFRVCEASDVASDDPIICSLEHRRSDRFAYSLTAPSYVYLAGSLVFHSIPQICFGHPFEL